ncbi:MAG: hypothetical protein ACD_18C00302G0007 [uncultured bacterium]|nr:MAG: hypothetical protein ACD_18C00302G0007 [uncultured bacterium]OGH84048.1 MAG: hypothetical protein A2488_02820 [Candidatus Magasanikbacteria bacterium RIFOXYC12_FULL_32_21b]OGH91094.1 MAG: hypothetical protein A2507_04890 [Candidatus Magasanikbacteria bacterium RIFOXYD12_FULL_33_17]HAO52275.1 DUF1294 domain-containing protein [Candidatus Magasanikbacteria bacterium]
MIELSKINLVLIVYFTLINLITFITFGIDKSKSINNARRVSEKTLWIMSFLGGSLGAMLAMKMFRHKTKKLSFQAMMAVILVIQIFVIYLILK